MEKNLRKATKSGQKASGDNGGIPVGSVGLRGFFQPKEFCNSMAPGSGEQTTEWGHRSIQKGKEKQWWRKNTIKFKTTNKNLKINF